MPADQPAASHALQESNRASQPDKRLVEAYFVFACVWAFGGTMLVDKTSDYRAKFSKWWTAEWKAVTFPEGVRPPSGSSFADPQIQDHIGRCTSA